MGLGLLVLVAFALCYAGDAAARKWTSGSEKLSIEAEFMGLTEGEVSLKRQDGEIIKIPLKRLSPADQLYVNRMVKNAPKDARIDNPIRTWTDILGRKVDAQLVDIGDGTVSLRLREGRLITAPFGALSREDQEFVSMKSEEVAAVMDPRAVPTHTQVGSIRITGAGMLRTFCVNSDGNLLVGVGGDEERYVRAGEGFDVQIVPRPAEIQVISPDGKVLSRWQTDITPRALCLGPDRVVYVGGSGRLGKIDSQGKIYQTADSPSFIEALGGKWQPTGDAKRGPAAKGTASAAASGRGTSDDRESPKPSDAKGKPASSKKSPLEAALTGSPQETAGKLETVARSKTDISSIAVTEQELFVACKARSGYAVYAMDHDFRRPRRIVNMLSGCCGQMDIKASGNMVFAAENSRHRVDCFDRNGRAILSFGRSDRRNVEGFGSCCNPMNLRFGTNGELYTAESGLGRIKRYTPQGKFIDVVANVKVAGGCKHVAIDFSPDGNRVYMLNLGASEIAVLAKRDSSKADSGTSLTPNKR